jgi:hypothetical protein
MKHHRLSVAALAALALAGCSVLNRGPDTEVSTDDGFRNTRWHASLVSPEALAGAVQMKGQATMTPAGRGRTTVVLRLDNATAGGVHPWQVHQGQCGSDEGTLGTAESYRAIRVDGDGNASSTVTLPFYTPTSGRYFVSVQASAANSGVVVACGNLAPPAQ